MSRYTRKKRECVLDVFLFKLGAVFVLRFSGKPLLSANGTHRPTPTTSLPSVLYVPIYLDGLEVDVRKFSNL